MKYTRIRPILKFICLTSAVLLNTLHATPANAVVLEQKWQAGQQLGYDLKLDGTLHLTAPADTPMIGGMPLELLLKGDGQSTLLTHDVDEFGTATVAGRLERLQLKMNETTFNQNGVLGIRDGRATMTLNGQSVMPARDISSYLAPRYGLRITKQLHVVGMAPLKVTTPEPVGDDDDKNAKQPALNLPFNMVMMMQAVIARTLPALLPTRDVKVGDDWKANVEWPQPPNTPRAELQKPAGEFNLKAEAEEEVLGRKTVRIAVDGSVQVDEAQTKIITDEIEKRRGEQDKEGTTATTARGMKLPKLFAVTQKVNGNLWFDPAAGQIVSTDLRLNSAAQTRKTEKGKVDGALDFAGNLKMELRKVSYENQ